MILKVGNNKLDTYNDVALSLNYEGVSSCFQFSFYFDPENEQHKAMFVPGSYADVTIEHKGELLLTGTLLSQSFKSGPVRRLMDIAGYSKTGVLEDCEIPPSAYPLQVNKLSLKQIAEKVIKPFRLKLIVDASVAKEAATVFKQSTCDASQRVKSYLAALANQKHIILSHTNKGELLLTKEKVNQQPVFYFDGSIPVTEMSLKFDGQRMHSTISLIKQASKSGKGNAGQTTVTNPYVSGYRPTTKRQTSGRDVDTGLGARNMLSDELKELELIIEVDRWVINNTLVRPNNIISVTNPDLHIYNPTRFFITQVDYKSNSEYETATLKCVLPEVYNSDTPKNIFK